MCKIQVDFLSVINICSNSTFSFTAALLNNENKDGKLRCIVPQWINRDETAYEKGWLKPNGFIEIIIKTNIIIKNCNFFIFLEQAITFQSFSENFKAVSLPMPDDAPTIKIVEFIKTLINLI